MAIVFDGNRAAEDIYSKLRDIKANLSLSILYYAENQAQKTFITLKQKVAERLGVSFKIIEIPTGFSTDEVQKLLEKESKTATGLLVQLPLPENLDRYKILNAIPYNNDVEGLSDKWMGELAQNDTVIYSPVAKAAMTVIEEAVNILDLKLQDLNVVIVGNSYLAGRPAELVLARRCNSVTVTNHHTSDLSEITRKADIILSATGVVNIISADMVKEDAILIDVGFEKQEDGSITGDIHPDAFKKSAFHTPVPGGIGPLTIAFIFENLYALSKLN